MELRFILPITLTAMALLLSACEPAQESDTPTTATTATNTTDQIVETDADIQATEKLWQQGARVLEQSVAASRELQSALPALLSNPSQETLQNIQGKWQNAEHSYNKFFFYSQLSTIAPEVFSQLAQLWFAVSAYPIQPGYLDYFGPYQYSGLVHDIGIPLDAETLRHQHGMTDTQDAILGLYAIEYMLFGENHTRPASDYIKVTELKLEHQQIGYKTIEEVASNRRRELLQMQIALLVSDTQKLLEEWNSQTHASMYARWQKLPVTTKRITAIKTIERTLTQLLVITAAVAHASNTNQTSDQTESATVSESPTASDKKIHSTVSIGNAIESLEVSVLWLNPELRSNMLSQLQKAEQHLKNVETDTDENAEDGKETNWSSVYGALKQAMDLLSGTPQSRTSSTEKPS